MQQLVDGDPAAQQRVATDRRHRHPDMRPTSCASLQSDHLGEKFDPSGAFVRRWVPELAHVPTRTIHTRRGRWPAT
ncbi:MAG: FAD-binding domain-containing protein [Caldilineaceae bacterium]